MARLKKGEISQGHWQTHGHCYLHFGSPWQPSDETAGSTEHPDLRTLTTLLMEKISDQAQKAMLQYANATGMPVELASFNMQ